MSDAKPYASLSSGLLARKGGAKPAMRPQAFTHFHGNIEDLGWNDMGGPEIETYDHVPSSISALTPAPNGRSPLDLSEMPAEPPVVEQRRALEQSFPPAEPEEAFEAQPEPAFAPEPAFEAEALEAPEAIAPAPAPKKARTKSAAIVPLPTRSKASAGKPKAAFTLRLDAERHLRLRLACAVTRRSAQQLVTSALDEFLAGLPEVEELAGRVPAEASQR